MRDSKRVQTPMQANTSVSQTKQFSKLLPEVIFPPKTHNQAVNPGRSNTLSSRDACASCTGLKFVLLFVSAAFEETGLCSQEKNTYANETPLRALLL